VLISSTLQKLRKILLDLFTKTIYFPPEFRVRPLMYNKTMKKKNPTHKGIENKPYIEAMREIRRSSAAGTHDNRPNRLRTRKAIKTQAIKEQD